MKIKGMGFYGLGLLVLGLNLAPVGAVPVTNDLWDLSQGTTVTAHSAVIGPPYYSSSWSSDVGGMFGGTAGFIEAPNTLFQDWMHAGTTHWVEWQTASTVTLRSLSLYSMYDGGVRDANYRGFTLFTLYGWDDVVSSWDQIYQLAPIDPATNRLVSAYASPLYSVLLDYAVDVTPYTTNLFRAEFTQAGPGGNASGTRIMELDGFDTFLDGSTGGSTVSVPEPAAFTLLGLGLVGLRLSRRRSETLPV